MESMDTSCSCAVLSQPFTHNNSCKRSYNFSYNFSYDLSYDLSSVSRTTLLRKAAVLMVRE